MLLFTSHNLNHCFEPRETRYNNNNDDDDDDDDYDDDDDDNNNNKDFIYTG